MFVPSLKLPPIVLNASAAEYHKQTAKKGEPDFVMSRSELLKFSACPNKWLRSKTQEKTAAMDYGSILDVLLLTPDSFDSTFAIFPDTYQPEKGEPKPWSANATFCREWKLIQEKEGKRCVWKEDAEEAKLAVEQIRSLPFLEEYLAASDAQVYVNADWHDTETGIVVPCKALIDLVPKSGNELADLKSTTDASRKAWKRKVDSEGYAYQAAFYLMAYSGATSERRTVFRNIISESGHPFECTHREIHYNWILPSRNKVEEDMRIYCRSLLKGAWAGYDSEPIEADPYMFKDA